MLSHSAEISRFWLPLVALSLIGIGALGYEVRRLRYSVWEVLGALISAPIGAITMMAVLGVVIGFPLILILVVIWVACKEREPIQGGNSHGRSLE